MLRVLPTARQQAHLLEPPQRAVQRPVRRQGFSIRGLRETLRQLVAMDLRDPLAPGTRRSLIRARSTVFRWCSAIRCGSSISADASTCQVRDVRAGHEQQEDDRPGKYRHSASNRADQLISDGGHREVRRSRRSRKVERGVAGWVPDGTVARRRLMVAGAAEAGAQVASPVWSPPWCPGRRDVADAGAQSR